MCNEVFINVDDDLVFVVELVCEMVLCYGMDDYLGLFVVDVFVVGGKMLVMLWVVVLELL